MFEVEGGGNTELLGNAFTGFNLIPTVLILLIVLYWLIVIIGVFDLDFLEFDLDIEGGEGGGILDALALFLKIGEVPLGLVLSLFGLNFWVLAMCLHFVPLNPESFLYGLVLLPVMALSLFITRLQMIPLSQVFGSVEIPNDLEHKVMDRRCRLLSDVRDGKMGQARIDQKGAGIVLNVKAEFEKEQFEKGEVAYVFRKDEHKNLFYITKPIYKNDIFKQTEGN